MALSAWTKVGDQLTPNGKWSVYRYPLGIFREAKVQQFDNLDRAEAVFEKRERNHRRGGLYLVSPDGFVCACVWIPPVRCAR